MSCNIIIFSLLLILLTSFAKCRYNIPLNPDKTGSQYDLISTIEIHHLAENSVLSNTRGQKGKPASVLKTGCKLNVRLIERTADDEIYSLEVSHCKPEPCNATQYFFLRREATIRDIYCRRTITDDEPANAKWSAALSFLHALQDQEQLNARGYESGFITKGGSTGDREFYFRQIGHQDSISKVLKYGANFRQKTQYGVGRDGYLQCIKVDEDFVVEAHSYNIIRIQTKTTIALTKEMTHNSEISHGKECGSENIQSVDKCLEFFEKDSNHYFVTDSIETLFHSTIHGKFIERHQQKKTGKCILGSKTAIKDLNSYSTSAAPVAFVKILQRIERMSEADVKICLEQFENSENLFGILNVLAVSGRFQAYEAVRKFSSHNKDVWNFFVGMLPYALNPDYPIIEDLMSSLSKFDHNDPYDQTALSSAASILNRMNQKHDRANKSHSPEKLAEFPQRFVDIFEKCETRECYEITLHSFLNLRSPQLLLVVQKRLCSEFAFDWWILRLIKSINPKHWSNDQFRRIFYRIFTNSCPTPRDQSTRMLAAELLISCAEEKNVNDTVFGMINRVDEKGTSGREILSYLLSLVKQMAHHKLSYKRVFQSLREKNYFDEFFGLASNGQSLVFENSTDVFGLFRPFYHLGIEFGGGLLKRSDASLGLFLDGQPSTVLGFDLYSSGLSSILTMIGGASQEAVGANAARRLTSDDGDSADDDGGDESGRPTAGLRLTFFDHSPPPLVFFRGQAGLMGAAWSADGQTATAFNGTVALTALSLRLPSAGGPTFAVRLTGALALRIDGSAEISLWYRNLKAAVTDRASFVTMGHLSIISDDSDSALLSRHSIDLSSQFGVDFLTEVDFYESPARMCFQVDQIPAEFILKLERTSARKTQGAEKIISRRVDGSCWAIPRMSLACSRLYT